MKSVLEKYGVVSLADLDAEHIRELIPEFIHFGQPNIFVGETGCGKSAVMCAIAAAITGRRDVAGRNATETGSVIMMSVDDSTGITASILRENGVPNNCDNLPLVYVLNKYVIAKTKHLTSDGVDELLTAIGDVKALIVDSVEKFISPAEDAVGYEKVKASSYDQVQDIQNVCNKHNCALIISVHGYRDLCRSRDDIPLDDCMLSEMSEASVYSMHTVNHKKNAYGIKKTRDGKAQEGFFIRYTIGENRKITWV